MSNPQKKPFSRSDLECPEYRARLMRKLNCLIAVLEVACAKVRRSLREPDADEDRLLRIQDNLSETLTVCQRAKSALERREKLPDGLPEQITRLTLPPERGADEAIDNPSPFDNGVIHPHRGARVEMSSEAELASFKARGPITPAELAATDFEDLQKRLQS